MKKLLCFVLLFSTQIFAAQLTKDFSFSSYDKAKASENNFLKFHMESTKLGMVTTGFDSYVKKFKVTMDSSKEKGKTILKNTVVELYPRDIDTDNKNRNSKMYRKTFEVDKYPYLKVEIPVVVVNGKEQTVDAWMTIRNKRKKIKITLKVSAHGKDGYIVSGSSNVTLTALEVPDPSIFIATVRDLIEISFKLVI